MVIYGEYVPIFKALADETRLKIVDILSCGELCACKILESFNITQPTLSYHMKILTESGVVIARREGAWIYYCLNTERMEDLIKLLSLISKNHEDCICKSLETCCEKCK